MTLIPDPLSFLKDLIAIAKKDNILSSEERKLIDRISRNLRKYEDAVNMALEDGVITSEELKSLLHMQKRIVEDVTRKAEKMTDKVTEDEKIILARLLEYIADHSIKV